MDANTHEPKLIYYFCWLEQCVTLIAWQGSLNIRHHELLCTGFPEYAVHIHTWPCARIQCSVHFIKASHKNAFFHLFIERSMVLRVKFVASLGYPAFHPGSHPVFYSVSLPATWTASPGFHLGFHLGNPPAIWTASLAFIPAFPKCSHFASCSPQFHLGSCLAAWETSPVLHQGSHPDF